MVKRQYWIRVIEKSWTERSVLWLFGVRRVGKTFLCRSLPNVEYFDCELPSTRRMLADPEAFLANMGKRRIVLDEVHRLQNPSEVLKVASDHFPQCRVLATGSSTLASSRQFKDTLTGRKRNIWLSPIILSDMIDFGHNDIHRRLLHGGLPPFFLSETPPEIDFQEWMDDYWAKDIQTLFRLGRRDAFQRFCELLFSQSGGIFEATAFATPCEVSRTTITNYLQVLAETMVVHIVRPFSTHRPTEIVSAPRVYGFDTGFVCCHRGWTHLRPEDYGPLWEHLVLNEMLTRIPIKRLHYWRDKRGHEVDFVLFPSSGNPSAIECKWNAERFDPTGLTAFRRLHPGESNWCVAHDVDRPFSRRFGSISVRFSNLEDFVVANTSDAPTSIPPPSCP